VSRLVIKNGRVLYPLQDLDGISDAAIVAAAFGELSDAAVALADAVASAPGVESVAKAVPRPAATVATTIVRCCVALTAGGGEVAAGGGAQITAFDWPGGRYATSRAGVVHPCRHIRDVHGSPQGGGTPYSAFSPQNEATGLALKLVIPR